MSFIDIPLDGVQEDAPVAEGVYVLRIHEAKEKTNEESGRTSIQCMILIENPTEDNPSPAPIFHYLPIPNSGDNDKARRFLLLQMKRFLTAFGIPHGNGVELANFPGATGEILVILEDDPAYGQRNSLHLPRIGS